MHFKGFSPSLTCHIETSATVPKFLSTIFSREEAEDLYMNPVWMDTVSHILFHWQQYVMVAWVHLRALIVLVSAPHIY